MKIILDFNHSTSYISGDSSSTPPCLSVGFWQGIRARGVQKKTFEKNPWSVAQNWEPTQPCEQTVIIAAAREASEPSCVCARGTKEGNWRIFEHEVYLIKSVLLIYHFRFEFYQKRYESLHHRDALLFDTKSFQCSHIRRHLTPLCCARVMARARPFPDLSLPRNPRISRHLLHLHQHAMTKYDPLYKTVL